MLSTSSKLKVKFLFINQLVNKYDKDPLITQYVRNLTWYITPVVNPDGYEFSRSSQDPDVRPVAKTFRRIFWYHK